MKNVSPDFEFEILSDETERSGERRLPDNADSEKDLGALFDSILDELEAEELIAANDRESEPKSSEVLAESAASVEEIYMEEIKQRLQDLLPRIEASAAEGVEFDEELYQELMPLFSAMLGQAHKQRK